MLSPELVLLSQNWQTLVRTRNNWRFQKRKLERGRRNIRSRSNKLISGSRNFFRFKFQFPNIRLKQAESRSEYAEMNISKLHLRIDDLEDEIIREKMKINVVCGQLDETFHEMLNKY